MIVLQIVCYFSIIVLIVGTALKALKIATMPTHLRWDLYPIPHEKGKEHYGGSYYEESDWWTKPANFSLVGEIKEMGKEILAIQSLFRNNRSLWYFSFPFHAGLYFLVAFAGLLFLGAVFQERGLDIATGSPSLLGRITYSLTMVVGISGWIAAALGTFGLLLARIFRLDLRRNSVRADYFNLILLLALFISGILAWITVDRSFAVLRGFAQQFILFRPLGHLPAPVIVQLVLTAIFFTYLPFTHMTHFVGKYFTYHKVRWQDEPNRRGGKIEREVLESLGTKQDWAAPHIKTGATWGEAATDSGNVSKKEDA